MLEISGALLALLLAYFFVTIAVSVELPAGLLPDTRPAYRALKIKKKTPAREGRHRRISNIGTVLSVAEHGSAVPASVTATTGVRGFGKGELQNATPDVPAVDALEASAVAAADARAFAGQAGLQAKPDTGKGGSP